MRASVGCSLRWGSRGRVPYYHGRAASAGSLGLLASAEILFVNLLVAVLVNIGNDIGDGVPVLHNVFVQPHFEFVFNLDDELDHR